MLTTPRLLRKGLFIVLVALTTSGLASAQGTTSPKTAPAKSPASAPTQAPPQYAPFRPQDVVVTFKVKAGQIRFEDGGKAVSSDATVVRFAVGDSDIELVSDKVVTEGKNFVITTKKYGKMRVVFDDTFGAAVWVTPAQRVALMKLASAGNLAAKTSPPLDAIEGKLQLPRGMSVNGPSSASLRLKSDDGEYEVVFTDKTTVPSDWRQRDYSAHELVTAPGGAYLYIPSGNASQEVGYGPNGEVMMVFSVSGRYSVRGRITARPQGRSAGRIDAEEISPK